jgi:hypothetical protein
MNISAQSLSLGDASPFRVAGAGIRGVWTRWFARAIAPRKHFRVLPTRTRPSLFGGD